MTIPSVQGAGIQGSATADSRASPRTVSGLLLEASGRIKERFKVYFSTLQIEETCLSSEEDGADIDITRSARTGPDIEPCQAVPTARDRISGRGRPPSRVKRTAVPSGGTAESGERPARATGSRPVECLVRLPT